ncbi:MAG TPA: lysylphosphatidylglycerol synthase transmembrane domain-containing protein [Candidatus Binatia bacterium]|nr:lysylphosphatidylglycerol synthase transmembrane domain-containing protein [Candidatus Binatia bacterium]
MASTFYRGALGVAFKVVVSVSLTASLFYTGIDLGQIGSHWREIRWGFLFLVTPVVFAINTGISVIRWGIVLGRQGVHVSFWPLVAIYTKGTILGSFAPGGLFSGDLYRMYSIAKRTGRTTISVSSVLTDRAMGVFALLICSASAFYYAVWSSGAQPPLALAKPVVFATGVFFLVLVAAVALIKYGLTRVNSDRSVISKLQRSLHTVPNYFSDKTTLGQIFVLSLLLQLGIVLWTYALSLSMSVRIPLPILCMTVPLINLFALLPVSIGGFGVREAAFVFFLTPFEVKPSEAVSISLLGAVFQNGLLILTWFSLSCVLHDDPSRIPTHPSWLRSRKEQPAD